MSTSLEDVSPAEASDYTARGEAVSLQHGELQRLTFYYLKSFLPKDAGERLTDDALLAHLRPDIQPADEEPIVRLFTQVFASGGLSEQTMVRNLNTPRKFTAQETVYMQRLFRTLGLLSLETVQGQDLPIRGFHLFKQPEPKPGPYKKLISSLGEAKHVASRLGEILYYERDKPGSEFLKWDTISISVYDDEKLETAIQKALAYMQHHEQRGHQALGVFGALVALRRKMLPNSAAKDSPGENPRAVRDSRSTCGQCSSLFMTR